jgi:hypothetical protein
VNRVRRLHRHGLKGCPRRRVYSWPKKGFVQVRWGRFFLTFRLLGWRGIAVIAVRKDFPSAEIIWHSSDVEIES